MKLKYAITLLLFSCLGLSALTAQSNLKDKLQLRNFFKDDDMPVHYLDEILSSSTEVKAICIQKEDLIPTYYGELCLLDSILNYQKDSFSHKVQSVERLYLETYLPENLVQLLAQSASVKTIMIKPLKKSYPKREIQKLSLLKKFEQLNYIEIADTSLAFIECIQQLENLDTVVWLNKYIPTLYLDRLTQINTLIIHHHKDAYNYRSWEIPPRFKSDFPTQLKTLYTEEYTFDVLGEALMQCKNLTQLTDASGNVDIKRLDDWRDHWLTIRNPFSVKKIENLETSASRLLDSICNLKRLKNLYVYVEDNYVDNITYLSCLSQLQSLHILFSNEHKLVDLPNTVYELSNLKDLNIENLSISDSIRYLSNLRRLKLAGTNAIILPDSIIHLQKLEHLDLSKCEHTDYPEQIYQLKQLDTLRFGTTVHRGKPRINAKKLKELNKLKYIEFSTLAIKNEIHYKKIYEALPNNAVVRLKGLEFKTPEPGVNIGLYTEYGWKSAMFTGVEFLYYHTSEYSRIFTKQAGKFKQSVRSQGKEESFDYFNPFSFHTFSLGVEWNYLRNSNFLMGYRLGYNYSRGRDPIAFQVDFIAYTNYKNTFDPRLAPRIAFVPLRSQVACIYLYYSYKIPLVPKLEDSLVARHNIGLSIRATIFWPDTFMVGVGF